MCYPAFEQLGHEVQYVGVGTNMETWFREIIIHMKKYSTLIGSEQCSSSVTPVQITHPNSGL